MLILLTNVTKYNTIRSSTFQIVTPLDFIPNRSRYTYKWQIFQQGPYQIDTPGTFSLTAQFWQKHPIPFWVAGGNQNSSTVTDTIMTDGCGEIFTDFVHYHITNCPVDAGSVEDTRYSCEVLTKVTYVDKIKIKKFIRVLLHWAILCLLSILPRIL